MTGQAAVALPGDQRRVASDTMEFAVASVAAALPFADRVRARLGSVELLVFRIGDERFAADLAAVEEAVERSAIHSVPEAPPMMLGVVHLREQLVPVYSPEQLLGGRPADDWSVLLVIRRSDGGEPGERRVAIAVDDVEDVALLPLEALRPVPTGTDPDGILLGVTWRGERLFSVIDLDGVLDLLVAEPVPELA